ncbi:MAG: molybdate ABC transporter permease subunit [Deltaproteobacteria bacterium]|nr:molybdate ABC transporter permease subunit [Deltaproteobacteria bacterium]MDQ3296471.1 molybdate ABC transporter permease subunit [Myxococcota bacterium]
MSWAPLWLSFEIASLATVLTLVVGTALALLLNWRRLPMRNLFDAIISAPLVLPPTVLGYYLLVVLGTNSALGRAWESIFGSPIIFTFTGAVIAAAVGSLPLVVRSVRLGLEAVDPSVVNAARTLGARPVRVLFTIVLPLAAPGIVAGAMLGFARALGDYGATQMVAGSRIDGTPTASIFVMDQLLAGNDDQVFKMSLAATLFGIAMLYYANRLTRRMHPNRS